MATIRLVPSTYTRSSTSRVTVTSPENMYYNTDHTTNYCSIRGRNSSSNTYYAFIHGFNFNDIPINAVVSSFEIKIRCYKNSYLQQTTTYRPRLASSPSNSSALADTTLDSDVTTTSGGTVYTFPNGSLTWNTLRGYGTNFSIEIPLRSSSSSYPYLYVYGAEINVTYTAEEVHVTGVDVSPETDSIEVGETTTLTATVFPRNATNKTVTWSTSNSSIATVSDGVVTGVAAGSARITATTQDGSYTDYCDITVTPAITYDFVPASSLEVGNDYLISNGNSGSIYLLTDESGGSRLLKGAAATVSNGKITITNSIKSKALFSCVRYTSGNDITITLEKDGKYLYSDSASGLRMNAPATLDRFWHYRDNKFWQFKSTSTDGYTDTSSEYKYYLQMSGTNYTDNHVTSPSIQDSTLPEIYIWVESIPVTGISLNSTATVEVGSTITLVPTITPSNATNQSVSWSTGSGSIATVNNGVVTGVAAGTTTITVTTIDGGYTASCTVTVTPLVLPDVLWFKNSSVTLIGSDTNSNYDEYLDTLVIAETNVPRGSTLYITGTMRGGGWGSDVSYPSVVFDDYVTLPTNIPSTSQNELMTKYCSTNNNRSVSLIYDFLNYSSSWQIRFTATMDNSTLLGNYNIYKVTNEWTPATKVYKKVSGSWVEQVDLTTVFDATKNYVKG